MRKQSETLSDLTSKTEATWIKDFPNLHGFLDPSPLGVHYLNQIAPYLHYPHELLNMFPGHFWRGGKNLLSDVVVDLEREVKSQFSNQEYFYRWSNA